jgi:epoxyqueuosine reductase
VASRRPCAIGAAPADGGACHDDGVLSRAYADDVCEAGRAAGLDRVGIAGAQPFADTRVLLEQRRAAGLAATMQFTYRNPARSTDPSLTLPGVAALVVGARRYDRAAVDLPEDGGPWGRVARYAAADHYGDLRQGLAAIADRLQSDGWAARVVLDDNALVDRAAAHRAALGWFGKNANILVPGLGSWVVLGSVLTDATLPPALQVEPDGCGSCGRCIEACPTDAIIAPGVVDARRCLAWLVQAEGVFPAEHRESLGDRLYGCDDCQEVCPPSRHGPDESVTTGDPSVGSAPGPWVDVLDLMAADDKTLLARFGRWYIPRREPRYLRRNALIVLGNTASLADPGVGDALDHALDDPDPVVRAHAVWAARRLGLDPLPNAVLTDGHPLVRAEIERAVSSRAPAGAGS